MWCHICHNIATFQVHFTVGSAKYLYKIVIIIHWINWQFSDEMWCEVTSCESQSVWPDHLLVRRSPTLPCWCLAPRGLRWGEVRWGEGESEGLNVRNCNKNHCIAQIIPSSKNWLKQSMSKRSALANLKITIYFTILGITYVVIQLTAMYSPLAWKGI